MFEGENGVKLFGQHHSASLIEVREAVELGSLAFQQ
jgi:hypothetical protein